LGYARSGPAGLARLENYSHTIVQPEANNDERTKPNKAKALHYMQHHIHPDLKCEYMSKKDPMVSW
jgi:hypothetical protein